jgi:hypothetical protein
VNSPPTHHDHGNCYPVACWLLIDPFGDIPSNAILVHGEPTLQRAPFNKFGHAWVEIGDSVFDFSNGRNIVIRKEVYYQLGKIEESSCRRYTKTEARRMVAKFKHWGPWEGTCPSDSVESSTSA